MSAKPWILAATALLIIAAPAASAETLEDALAMAYRTNPTIRAERARLKATEELKAQAWAGALPQVSARASYSKVDDTQTINASSFDPTATGTFDRSFDLETTAVDVQAEQPLFTGFRNLNAIRQAKARARAGGAQLAAVEQDVLRRVASAYFDVIRDMKNYEANLNNVEVLVRQKEEAELRFEVGEVTRTDVAQADARLARARASLAGAQAQLAVSRAFYTELVGQAPGTLDEPANLPEVPETIESATALAHSYSPLVIGARAQEDAARKGVSIARSAFSPTISATAQYQYAEEPSTFINNDESFAYGVRATVPIFLGGIRFSQVREARAVHDSARESVVEAERGAARAATAAFERLIAARQTIESARVQVEANALALSGVRREAQLGARTTLDVLDAEQEYLNAQVALSNAERDVRVGAFDLLAAAGVLNPDAIGVEAARLIPDESE